jgi:ring-1,2-phenylacetyl-CoA epoxidase subunit PaaC
MENAIQELWPYTGEMFIPPTFETNEEKRFCMDVSNIRNEWMNKVKKILGEATLPLPSEDMWMQSGGKEGIHTEHLGFLLAEMQFLQRAYPGLEW